MPHTDCAGPGLRVCRVKILFNHHLPFSLTRGGTQRQIEQTRAALEEIGVAVEPLRWWDERQTGEVLQHFGRIPAHILRGAQRKGMKVVMLDLLTEAGSRSGARLKVERIVRRAMRRLLPRSMLVAYHWDSYRLADACLVGTTWEAHLIAELFGAPANRIHVVPNGVEGTFWNSQPAKRGPWLVCTATITQRKRVLELAQAAVLGQAPLWVIGEPYSDSEPYAKRFLELAQQNPRFLRYEGRIVDRARLAQAYREARGFVLLSAMESLSLSASEAAACQCPLLLSDLPWARAAFGQNVTYCPITSPRKTAQLLRRFYDLAPGLKPPPKPPTWQEVARQLKSIYASLLDSARQGNDTIQ